MKKIFFNLGGIRKHSHPWASKLSTVILGDCVAIIRGSRRNKESAEMPEQVGHDMIRDFNRRGNIPDVITRRTNVRRGNLIEQVTRLLRLPQSLRSLVMTAQTIALALIISLFTISESWACVNNQTCGVNGHESECCWEIVGNTLKITGTGQMRDYSNFDWSTLTTGAPWGEYKGIITSASVDGVSNIGMYALAGLSNMRTLDIGKSVETISGYGVAYAGLSSLIIPDNVQTIQAAAISQQMDAEGNRTLTYLSLPAGLSSIDGSIGGADSNLTTISIPDSWTAEEVATWSGAMFGSDSKYITTIECRGENGQPGDDSKCYAALAGKFIRDENGRCTATYYAGSACLSLVQKVGQTCLNNKFNKEGECIEESACTGEYLISGNECIKMPGCIGYTNGACGSCERGYLKKGNGCVSAIDGCGNGYLEKDGSCISAANGCGSGYKNMGGYCNRVRWTPAEAAEVLNDDDNNTVTLIFKM